MRLGRLLCDHISFQVQRDGYASVPARPVDTGMIDAYNGETQKFRVVDGGGRVNVTRSLASHERDAFWRGGKCRTAGSVRTCSPQNQPVFVHPSSSRLPTSRLPAGSQWARALLVSLLLIEKDRVDPPLLGDVQRYYGSLLKSRSRRRYRQGRKYPSRRYSSLFFCLGRSS